MIHSDGVPLYKSKNCSAWPILGAVLELPPFSRTRADNILLLAIWVDDLSKISEKLRSMHFIHDILRRPRSLANIHKWKASEVRTFILYIGLPVLVESLPEEISGNLALYTVILRLLHDYWDNNKNINDSVCSLLKIYIKNLSKNVNSDVYPPKMLTISTHTHLHLPFQCIKFGRLDWLSNFVFESFLGFLKAFVKGSSGAGDQIAFAFISNFFLPKIQENVNRSYGHFSIDQKTFGSNILKMKNDELINFLNNVYIVVKRVEPSLVQLDGLDVFPISCIRSRCFSIPLGKELMVVTSYSCAYEHN
ncbi:unnamed protein product [Rotaria sp. Silwood2]|nr:unnamed protein product [Rotaria sp. Silwood2]CAF2898866.1 unnamed protein product [Rotaria sp. Silwood2]CAF3300763.1 unnamed protein product [Rotaria sp. Silwood2]CAF4029612.1 unnamed protein product [Rotaria sp. Silwood2]CAF4273703.1 unnamed protein product [Rotaria sp. Silwood2]